MEFINKIELQGTVGSAKVTTVGESKLVRFSLCTHQAYNDSSEAIVVECTWFNCIAWEGEKIKDVSQIKSNDIVHLKGRVRAHSCMCGKFFAKKLKCFQTKNKYARPL